MNDQKVHPNIPQFIVGIGASGLGIGDLCHVIENIDVSNTAAVIVASHLPRRTNSKLATILQRKTGLPVVKVDRAYKLHAGHLYVIAENTYIEMDGDQVLAFPRPDTTGNYAINRLFTSIAKFAGDKSIGLVLRGMGEDGIEGMKAIEACGGYAIVQEPDHSAHSQMPYGVIHRDHPSVILPLDMIAQHLNVLIGQKHS